MNYPLMTIAGLLGMAIALIHGYLGYRSILSSITGLPSRIKLINDTVFQLSTLYWFAGGLMLVLLRYLNNDDTAKVVALIVVFLYASAAIGNGLATRGRHFGWVVLAAVTGMIVYAI